jgi:hypothetical protein
VSSPSGSISPFTVAVVGPVETVWSVTALGGAADDPPGRASTTEAVRTTTATKDRAWERRMVTL